MCVADPKLVLMAIISSARESECAILVSKEQGSGSALGLGA